MHARILRLAIVAALALPACGEDAGATSGDTSGATDTSGGGDADAALPDAPDADATGDAAPDGDDPDVAADAGDAEDGSGRDVVDGECEDDTNCPSRFACVAGECVERCASSVDCADGNVCTEDRCEGGLCTFVPVEASIADLTSGDCRRLSCVDGSIVEVDAPTDLPPDDLIFCTREECNGRFPRVTPDHTVCDDGDETNGFEVCVPEEGGCVTGEDPPWVCEDFDPGWELTETCGNGQDDDNDGVADEDCPCEFGSVQRCFLGPPGARGVGGCLDGSQQCIDRDDPRWGPCEGGLLPSEETCDAKDNDCDGCIDDIPDCEPLLTCPVEDTARPLRYYPLDAAAIFGGAGETYTWTVVAPPNSATRGAEAPTAASTRFYMDVSGDYQVSLSVVDDKGDRLGCSWVVHVAGSGLRVEMRWDTFGSVDMDLHLARDEGPFCGGDDCYYANCRVWSSVGWGYAPSPIDACEAELGASSCPNPRLDIDNIRGFDPENINLDNPNDGDRFRVMAHMFSNGAGGGRATNPVMSIYCGGTLRGVYGEAPDLVGLTRAGGGCQGETWRVADVTMRVDPATGATDCEIDVLTDETGDWDVRLNTSAY